MASKVFIANLSAGGTVTNAFSYTLSNSISAIVDRDASWTFMNVDGADVVMARNLLTYHFLQDRSCDYLLFIDSDMKVSKKVLASMFERNVDIVGAIYTTRSRNWELLFQKIAENVDAKKAVAQSSSFNVQLTPGEIRIKQGYCHVSALGFGYVLIKRTLLERMVAEQVVKPLICNTLRKTGMKEPAFDFFGLTRIADGNLLSEDYSFCRRVRQLKDVPIHGYVDSGVQHIGDFEYEASFVEWLKAQAESNNGTEVKES